MRHHKASFVALGIACLALLISLTTAWARGVGPLSQLDLLIDVRHELVSGYVTEPDQQAMVEAAVRGMIDSIDDPYTVYLGPDELESFENHVRGTFSGIGAEVDVQQNRLRIVTPLEDSPAWRAGVLPGDIVLDIEGESTLGMNVTQAVQLLTGEAGTNVTIRVRHLSGEEQVITITREVIKVKTIRGIDRNDDGSFNHWLDPEKKIAYIRMTQFGTRTTEELRETLDELTAQGMQGLILDLRFNPGGLLEAAVEVSDMFLPGDQKIVSIKGRRVAEQVHSSTDSQDDIDVPLVILINNVSASASEVTAGALKENNRAELIGSRTFGKGSVQQVKMLEGGAGAIKMTNAYYYLPSGRKVHRLPDAETWGVDPTDGQYVSMTVEEVRAMLKARRDLVTHPEDLKDKAISPERIEQDYHDLQLAAGLRAMYSRLDQGQYAQVGEDNTAELERLVLKARLEQQKSDLAEAIKQIDERLLAIDRGEDVSEIDSEAAETVEP